MTDFDTPEGRFRFAEAHGPDAYNAAMQRHAEASTVDRIAGHAIRPVSSRFGRLFMVGDTGRAFSKLEQAREFARSHPA